VLGKLSSAPLGIILAKNSHTFSVINKGNISLYLTAFKFPIIKKYKEILYESGALYAAMSGSGSSLYGIFRQLPQNLEKIIPKGILFTV